ncbi:MAG: hypothetical protein KGI27_10985 [Thaumarchaeota archaeon]|nr:hypothetical protein [Nitrososphaerota archaeon]
MLPIFGQPQDTVGYSVWVPKKMIAGQDYQGLVVLDQAENVDNLFFLSTSDKSTIQVPSSVIIPAFSNHGIFDIKPLKEGNATVFAAFGGNLMESNTTVYQSNSQPTSLEIILPDNTTKAQNMLGYIFAQDEFGQPTPVNQDTEIYVTTSSMIQAPQTVTIPKGQYYTQLPLVTRGTGQISVSAEGLGTATATVTKTNDDVQVRFALAPDLVTPNSITHYFIWLEKEGKPFKPPYGIHAVLTSSDTDVARFGTNYDIEHFNDILYSTTLSNGVATGILHTLNSGNSTISVSVDGFGSSTATLAVGGGQNQSLVLGNQTGPCNFSCNPNLIKLWVYPPTFDGTSYGIVGLYRQVNDSGNDILIPLPADGSIVGISSDSSDLKYPNELEMVPERIPGTNQDDGLASSVKFDVIAGGTGNFTVTAAGPGKMPGSAQVSIMPRYYDSYHVGITPLPARAGITQDLGIMYIYDSSGAMVDPSTVFAEPPDITIKSAIKNIPDKLQFDSTNVILSGSISQKTEVSTSIAGLPSTDSFLIPRDIATNVEFDLPSKVHVGEKFPFVVYKTNSLGVPLQIDTPEELSALSGVTLDSSGKYMTISREGNDTIAILSSNGAVMEPTESFYNTMHVGINANNTILKVGKQNLFDITSDIENASYSFQSPFQVVQTGTNQYSISPSREGEFDVTMFANKDGFRPITDTLHFIAKKIIELTFSAKGNDGSDLYVAPVISIHNQTLTGNIPFDANTDTGFAHIEVPLQFNETGKNYVLDNVDISGQKFISSKIDLFLADDSRIQANYYRMIYINANNADGGGPYPYGTTVTLHAPDKWQLSFLVRDVFDHWEGNDLPFASSANNVSFVVKDNLFVTAVYRQDFTYLMLAIAGPVTGFFVLKKRNDITWHVKELEDKIKQLISTWQKKKKG